MPAPHERARYLVPAASPTAGVLDRGAEPVQAAYWEEVGHYRRADDPVVRAFAWPKLRWLQQYVPLAPEMLVLDIGCGNGTFQLHLSDLASTVGIDYSPHMLRMNPCPRKLRASAYALPFPDGCFDVVFESCLLHHLEEPEVAVREMRRVSKRYVVLNEPNVLNPAMLGLSVAVRAERGGLRFSAGHLRRLALQAQIRVLGQTTSGMVYQNKTPAVALPLLRWFDRPLWFGAYCTLAGTVADDAWAP
jgi:SAM-dependent methyltransferase